VYDDNIWILNIRNVDAAERRKQMIQESKFLGGDMEHTHLVKGLDYALLQKVKQLNLYSRQTTNSYSMTSWKPVLRTVNENFLVCFLI
jgi:IK cytokine